MSDGLLGGQHPLNAMVLGASRGLGLGFVRALLALPHCNLVYAACRVPATASALQALAREHPQRLRVLALDVTREADFAMAVDTVQRETDRLHLLLNVAGLLHEGGGSMKPERRVEELNVEHLLKSYAVNALGTALAAKHFLALLTHTQSAVFASLSARVGSITDNHLGGWYGYRAAKAAQNQFSRTFAIEAARRAPRLVVAALHPGTVDTELSRPFSQSVAPQKLLTVAQSVAALLAVINTLTPAQTGRFWAWDGSEIAW
jgi:NAD(P)-dependent dehydrogenase (short-subunit alcohol dehydrogenase family)